MFNSIYRAVGSVMPSGRKAGAAAFKKAANPTGLRAGMRGSASSRVAAASTARRSAYIKAGKTPARVGMAMAAAGSVTASKPNANQSRTSYRGPMQTGRGIGRFS